MILDATARLLAPKSSPAQPPRAKQDKQRTGAASGGPKRRGGKTKSGGTQQAQPARPAAEPLAVPKAKKKRSGARGRGGRPPEVTLRTGSQKDSTEQPSLMKPYYLSRDD